MYFNLYIYFLVQTLGRQVFFWPILPQSMNGLKWNVATLVVKHLSDLVISRVNVFCSENKLNNVSIMWDKFWQNYFIIPYPLIHKPIQSCMYMYILSPPRKSLGQEKIILFCYYLSTYLCWYGIFSLIPIIKIRPHS